MLRATWRGLETWYGRAACRRASPRPYRRGGGWKRGTVEVSRTESARQSSTLPTWRGLETWCGSGPRATPARQPSTLLMSGDGKRGVGHRPQATAPILDSTVADIALLIRQHCCPPKSRFSEYLSWNV